MALRLNLNPKCLVLVLKSKYVLVLGNLCHEKDEDKELFQKRSE